VGAIWGNNKRPFKSLKVAAHYGCHILRPRDVVQFDHSNTPTKFETLVEVTGGISVDWPLRLQCCGDPLRDKNEPLTLELMRKKMESARKAGADILCVACPHCQMQFTRRPEGWTQESDSGLFLPSLLYPQLLGLSLGLDEKVLGPIGLDTSSF
jgi:heterodisulfide reductase subunit B